MTWIEYQYIRIIVACGILAVGAFYDLKMRGVYNWVWMIGAGMAASFWAYDGIVGHLGIRWYTQFIISTLIVSVISSIMYKRRIIARADMYGLIVAAMLGGEMTITGSYVSPITIIENTLLLCGSVFIINAGINTINVIRGRKIFNGYDLSPTQRFFAFFVGHKVETPWFGFSMEERRPLFREIRMCLCSCHGCGPTHCVSCVRYINTLKFKLFHEEDDQYCKEHNVWVSPSIPFMLFLFLGYIVQMFYGDIILKVFYQVLK